MGSLLIADRRLRPPGLGRATAVAIPLAQLASWGWLLDHRPEAAPALAQLLPLLALAIAQTSLAGSPQRRALGLDLLGLNLGLGAELLLHPLSPLLPPVAWLLLSLPALAMLGHPIGLVFTGLAMLPKMAWLPILGFGILARLTANREAREAALAASPPDDRPTPMHDTPDAAA